MERRAGAIVRYLTDLRSILLSFAIFNFIITWMMDAEIHFTCAACPWFHPWSYLNEPTILLGASLFLSANRWWGNTVALLVSGYLLGYFVHILLMSDDPVMALGYDWKVIRMDYPYLVGSWDSQYLFALIVFCYSALSLKRNFLAYPVACKVEHYVVTDS
jgi:hypothetical protein